MFVAVVLENWVLRLVVYRKIDFRKVNQHRIELAMLLAKLVKPLRHCGTPPTWTRAANNDMQVKRYHPIIRLSAQVGSRGGKKAKHMALDTPSGFPLPLLWMTGFGLDAGRSQAKRNTSKSLIVSRRHDHMFGLV
jgi:hypothetical protein